MANECYKKININKYEAKVDNNPGADCNLDATYYDSCLNEFKTSTNSIINDLKKINIAIGAISTDPNTGSKIKKICNDINSDVTKISSLLVDNRNKLSKNLDAEFRNQLIKWMNWSKKQDSLNK